MASAVPDWPKTASLKLTVRYGSRTPVAAMSRTDAVAVPLGEAAEAPLR